MSAWSKNPPSEAGVYWFRRGPGGYVNAVLVENDDNVLYAAGLYVRAYHADTEWQRIPSPTSLVAMEACVEALRAARRRVRAWREAEEFHGESVSSLEILALYDAIFPALAAYDESREGTDVD